MDQFSFAPQQYPHRETQKNYVFVDEHNRHKRLKVMRACEGCRRRKIKCDAATNNTWPCSACIRLKQQCVRPNGFDGAADQGLYEGAMDPSQYQQMSMGQDPNVAGEQSYHSQAAYHDGGAGAYHTMPFDPSQGQAGLNYTTMGPGMIDQSYGGQNVFPTPPTGPGSRPDEPSPETYSPDSYQQQDLADLLGTLKVNEVGAAPYLRNKASFRREEAPAAEEDDEDVPLPPLPVKPGTKIRIPPELMPDDPTVMRYFELFFTHVHPYVPVLNQAMFYRQWHTDRNSISPLILEAIFAMAGRLAEDPGEGQTWLALVSRHADSFMDVPRLSTLQALLLILKAREAAPKRGYYYRSWMTVVQCVQMAKDLGLDEHLEEHEDGLSCEHSPSECRLRTRIWQTVFVTESMVGTPQGRYDLAVDLDTVDSEIPSRVTGGDETDYMLSRNFTIFSLVVRCLGKLSLTYRKLRKKSKEWAMTPDVQKLNKEMSDLLTHMPSDFTVSFPADGSAAWLPSSFSGNTYSYYYLGQILLHRPQLSSCDPSANDGLWKHHMLTCYDSAKALCRLQEAIINTYGLTPLHCMQRGYSFTVYAGLACIVLHLVAIVSPDPELNSDAREYFTRHMRVLERVMDVWPMSELQRQIDAVREAFSADTRKAFVLKPSFPYGSPHPSSHSSTPRTNPAYQAPSDHTSSLDQQLNAPNAQQVSYGGLPISPPISAGATDRQSNSPSQPLSMMPQGSQSQRMAQNLSLTDPPPWNPAKIFDQWNTTFGTPAQQDSAAQAASLNFPSPPGAPEASTLQDIQAVQSSMPAGPQQQMSLPQFTAPPAVQNFITPAMWQESVASVYEGGLNKRTWGDYTGNHSPMK